MDDAKAVKKAKTKLEKDILPRKKKYEEKKKAWLKEVGREENMTYDEELDEWICANGKHLTFQYESEKETDNGYLRGYQTDL